MHQIDCDQPISYNIYRRKVNKLNISFAKLGEEKCEVCIMHSYHIVGCTDPDVCEECIAFNKPLKTANIPCSFYKDDAKGNNNNNDKFSVDLQKVFMLPRMSLRSLFSPNVLLFTTRYSLR